jgi:hypothetical protein
MYIYILRYIPMSEVYPGIVRWNFPVKAPTTASMAILECLSSASLKYLMTMMVFTWKLQRADYKKKKYISPYKYGTSQNGISTSWNQSERNIHD